MRVLFMEKRIDYEPQGIMCLSSVLKAAGHEVRLAVEDYEDPLEAVRNFKPGIVAYSVLTGSQRYYFELNRRVKEVAPRRSADMQF